MASTIQITSNNIETDSAVDTHKSNSSVETVAAMHAFEIATAPPVLADNATLVAYLADLINAIYIDAEQGFWKEGVFARCSITDIQAYIRTGQLAIAWREGSSQSRPKDLAGCVRMQMLDERTGEFGMLVCDPGRRGAGIGRGLVEFAEDWAREQGAAVMQLELLYPDGWEQAIKARMAVWYSAMGYKMVRVAEMVDELPQLVHALARPSKVRVYHRDL